MTSRNIELKMSLLNLIGLNLGTNKRALKQKYFIRGANYTCETFTSMEINTEEAFLAYPFLFLSIFVCTNLMSPILI